MSGGNLKSDISAVQAEKNVVRGAIGQPPWLRGRHGGPVLQDACTSRERVKVAAQIQEGLSLAHYLHCAIRALNLGTSQIDDVDAIWNALGSMEMVVSFLMDYIEGEELLRTAQCEKLGDGEWWKLLRMCQALEQQVPWSGCGPFGSV